MTRRADKKEKTALAARWLILAASVMLLATALFHGSGYGGVARSIEASDVKPFLISAVKGLWLMFSIHLIVVSFALVAVSRSLQAKRFVLLCALFPIADTVILLIFAGVFAGTIMMAVAALLLIGGGLLLPRAD
ncbi:MAG: hypothetical protein AB1631_01955 [Acidobacteriota bacterium]